MQPASAISPHSRFFQEACRQSRLAAPRANADGNGSRPLARVARMLRDSEFLTSCMMRAFRFLQGVGINVTPSHYYWPVPDVAELQRRNWPSYTPSTFDLRLQHQVNFLHEITAEFGNEWRFPHSEQQKGAGYHYNNGFFEAVDAEIAYSVVRKYKPARILEVGTGYSTRLLAAALKTNLQEDSVRGELISIDPHSDRVPQNGFSTQVGVLPARVQDLDLELFRSLDQNDILFIDSSHIVGIGSDVVREVLEILPAIKPGVLIHVHDIFLPSDYPREAVLNNLCFWSEQYLLQAFLSFNPSFEVLWGSSAMQTFHRQELERAFPVWSTSYQNMPKGKRRFIPTLDHQRVWPSSFWMRRTSS